MSAAPRIMGLDGQAKMSKSKGNTIAPLRGARDAFWNKMRGAYTDPQRLRRSDPGRPEICNIYTMHKALSTPEQVDLTYKECTTAQRGCIDCKKILVESFERELVPLRTKRAELDAQPGARRQALAEGAEKARAHRAARRCARCAIAWASAAPRIGGRRVARARSSLRPRWPLALAGCSRPPPDSTPDGAVRLFLDDIEGASERPSPDARRIRPAGPRSAREPGGARPASHLLQGQTVQP